MNFEWTYEMELLDAGDRSVDLVRHIIETRKARSIEMEQLYKRYCAKELPIHGHEPDDPMEVNNKINNDFFGEIIDIKTGYFAGIPATYTFPSQTKALDDFIKYNRMSDLNAESTKMAAICGFSTRELYLDKKTQRYKLVNIKPWESILIGENGIDEAEYHIRVYNVRKFNDTEIRVELTDGKHYYFYRGNTLEGLKAEGSQPQFFGFCPFAGLMNNEELMGDAEKALSEIDGYDRVLSDTNSEFEAFRAAYLAFFGVDGPATDDEGNEVPISKNQTFYFNSNLSGGNQDAKFITKTIQTDAIEKHLDRLHNNIYRFTKTPDFSDEAFSGAQSGIALKHKLQPLENKTADFERKFVSFLIRQFEILNGVWAKERQGFDPLAIEMKFTRNFPKDLLTEAQTSLALKGLVPELIRLQQLSFIENAQKALDELNDEKEAYAELFMTGGGANNDQPKTSSTGNPKETNSLPKKDDAGTTK